MKETQIHVQLSASPRKPKHHFLISRLYSSNCGEKRVLSQRGTYRLDDKRNDTRFLTEENTF
jgi:hypothetical protein